MSEFAISRRIAISDSPSGQDGPPTLSRAALTPTLGSSDIGLIRQIAPPGVAGPSHSHDRDEVLIMVEGALRVETGSETIDVRPGDAVLLPAHTDHQLTSTVTNDAHWFVVSRAWLRFFLPDGSETPAPTWAQ
jgi:quercetin dioxygenase-like cupin family protein